MDYCYNAFAAARDVNLFLIQGAYPIAVSWGKNAIRPRKTGAAVIRDAAGAISESRRCANCNEPNCAGGCPLGISIPSVLSLCRARDLEGAAAALRERNPLPLVTGHLCPSCLLCERSCLLHRKSSSIRFSAIEAFLGSLSAPSRIKRAPSQPGRYLVVGSGPVGLTVAHDLFAEGYGVEVWESEPELGGCLRSLPAETLPPGIIEKEVLRMEASGIKFARSTQFREPSPSILQEFKGIVLAIGPPPFRLGCRIGLSESGRMSVSDRHETSSPRIFAVGGAVSDFPSVTEAMASGRAFVQKLVLWDA